MHLRFCILILAIFDCNAHVSAALYATCMACNHVAPACVLHLLQLTFVLFEILLGLDYVVCIWDG